ncbi:MAG: cation-translocating P-type ATPase [Haloplanus sp.]
MAASEASEPAPAPAGRSDDWHSPSLDTVFDRVESSAGGLTADEVRARLDEYGSNEIRRGGEVFPLRIFISQFQDVLIYILLFAALLSLGIGLLPGFSPHYRDASLILLILLANGVFGFVQDYQAEKSIEALREMSSPDATVVRDGETVTIDASEVVPGDVVVLEGGDAVPADARLIEANSLEADESTLTGESANVGKTVGRLEPDAPLATRTNMVYMNTTVVRGRGLAVVVRTGMDTEVGSIAEQIQTADEDRTPFQKEVDHLGRQIGAGVGALIVLVAAIQFSLTAASPLSILLLGVTLAVAAVPEGLPAVVTLTLALGARRMADRNALVRRLPVVESLGSVDVVVTDKTGTLTENRMTVTRIYASGGTYTVTGSGTTTDGEFRRDGERADPAPLEPILRCGAVCNDAERAPEAEERAYRGDPTEIALLVSAAKAGIDTSHERVREMPFSSERKRMTVVVAGRSDSVEGSPAGSSLTANMKGAPEEVLDHCDRVIEGGDLVELTAERREAILAANWSFAGDALRVLGFASKAVTDESASDDEIESGMVFLGLQGMIDPPRAEVPQAVADCRRAGIRAVMLTGDNRETAKAVGAEVGFDTENAHTGQEVEALPDSDLRRVVESVDIFARVSPTHKVRILEALQANDHTVAMTGDGVNDAPALRSADVGISMGMRGTDVAKQASDMILQDDDFATIRDAIAEGRGIFDNIRKFVNYLLSANAGEVLVVFLGVLVGTALFPEQFAARSEALVLTPVMLLWVNLVTDGLPALALGVDPKSEDILDRPPRPPGAPVIDSRMIASIVAIGLILTVTGLALFFYGLMTAGDLIRAQTLLFTFLVVAEVVRIQVIRSRYDLPLRSNRWLIGAIAITVALQLLVLYTPLHEFFVVRQLTLAEWLPIGVTFLAFLVLNLGTTVLFDRLFPDSS